MGFARRAHCLYCDHFVANFKQKEVAKAFVSRAADRKESPVLWKFKFHHEHPKCKHVNYIDRTEVEGENEFLFPPYSVFTVESVVWQKTPDWTTPHEVVLKVAPDNKLRPENLPLAPWG